MSEQAWIQTYTGRAFPLLAPTAKDVCIRDIAHALSNLCRFAGHTREYYSVAQHSVLVSHQVPEEDALAALLHDAPEAYLVDLPRPLKRSGMVDGYAVLEERVWAAVAAHFVLDEATPASVKEADTRMLLTEQRDLMGRQVKPWQDTCTPYDLTVRAVAPFAAKRQFLERFDTLATRRGDRLRAQRRERAGV